jgi:fatty-acyl-CoA synthase
MEITGQPSEPGTALVAPGSRGPPYVVLREGASADYEALRTFLAERVARWQLPERWAVIPSVPKTSVGKFDKKVIRRQYADGELNVTHL